MPAKFRVARAERKISSPKNKGTGRNMTEQGVSQEDSHKTRNQLKSIGLLNFKKKCDMDGVHSKVLMKQRYLKC